MPASFEELTGSPDVTIDDGRFSATRRFKVNWSDTIEFSEDLLGKWEVIGSSLVYTPPVPFPGIPLAICRRVNFVALGGEDAPISYGASSDLASNTNQPPFAIVTAEYAMPDNVGGNSAGDVPDQSDADVEPGTYLTISRARSQETLAVSGRSLKWNSSGKPLGPDAPYPIRLAVENLTLNWQRVPISRVPWSKHRAAMGKLNSSSYLGYQPRQLMFLGGNDTREMQINGDVLCSLQMQFAARIVQTGAGTRSGWDYQFNADTGDWDKVVTLSGAPLYQETGFANLTRF